MKKEYISLVYKINEELQEVAIAMISDFDFTGIEQNLDSVIITFEREKLNEVIKNSIQEIFSQLDSSIYFIRDEVIGEINWNEEWEKNVPAIKVNDKIGIAPEWKINDLDTEIKIKINPKMSFGTGDHASTRLISRLMETTVTTNSFWIDAGTGTGILAILAIKLGAKKCFAFDNNEWSIANSIENIELNDVQNEVDIQLLDLDDFELPKCDGIAANIFLNVILKSLKKFREALNIGGDLLIAGILTYDKEKVINQALKTGFELVTTNEEDEWTGFHFKAI